MEQTDVDLKVQRAIEARYLPDAREERRAAQEMHKLASAPRPSRVRWDTRPPKKCKPSDIEQEVAVRSADQVDRWRRKHRDVASNERALRKTRAEVEHRWDHKINATPATLEHAANHRAGPLARLFDSGAIDAEQLAAAVDIADAYERRCREVTVRTASLETRIDAGRRGDGAFYEALGAVQREVAYQRWSAAVRGPLAAVLTMIVGDALGYTIVARRWRMSNRRAKQLLLDALDLWWRELGSARRDVDAATLVAAHAGILA